MCQEGGEFSNVTASRTLAALLAIFQALISYRAHLFDRDRLQYWQEHLTKYQAKSVPSRSLVRKSNMEVLSCLSELGSAGRAESGRVSGVRRSQEVIQVSQVSQRQIEID